MVQLILQFPYLCDVFVRAGAFGIHLCSSLQAHFFTVLQLACLDTRGTKMQVLLIEALAFYDLRNLTSRNEIFCLCSLDGKNWQML